MSGFDWQKKTEKKKLSNFCDRNGLPLRGHRDYGKLAEQMKARNVTITINHHVNHNRFFGNFRKLFKFRNEAGDEMLKEHLKSSNNALHI
ncbi:hypothetical protein CEXT_11231 [Caerostris extrusa]|uniref:Transposase n=1 Tax=Caerostris extrusa TaxID=172846 RepID=A0AAV4XJ30_CAEEX|nr:hypothetical protein CEXT_11231 [Caerostris extrusa]